MGLGVSPVLDPAAAIGVSTAGGYPAAIGAAGTAIGSAVARAAGSDRRPTTVTLAGGVAGAVLGVLAATLLATVPFLLAVQVGLAGTAPGSAAVRGAATERTPRRLGTAMVPLALAPFAGTNVLVGLTTGGLAGFARLALAVVFVIYTVLLSYPFYRQGRPLRRARRV